MSKPKISLIVACDRRGLIGLNGKLPWNIKEDLWRFKALTLGKTVVMGRKTWESLPIKPLPGRQNVIISQSIDSVVDHFHSPLVARAASLDVALACADMNNEPEVFIIGGERLYREAIAKADLIYMTFIDRAVEVKEGDEEAYFPMDMVDHRWHLTNNQVRPHFAFKTYKRVS